jgi:hypothetical protein
MLLLPVVFDWNITKCNDISNSFGPLLEAQTNNSSRAFRLSQEPASLARECKILLTFKHLLANDIRGPYVNFESNEGVVVIHFGTTISARSSDSCTVFILCQ